MNRFAVHFAAISLIAISLIAIDARLQNEWRGALANEKRASERAWRAQKKNLLAARDQYERRSRVSDSLARVRPRVSVRILPSGNRAHLYTSAPTRIENPPIVDTSAVVTINDTAYAVPVRVAEVVEQQRVELLAADSLRVAGDKMSREIPSAVAAADSALTIATRRPPFLLRALKGATTVLCAAAGAGVGAAVGNVPGAVLGAGGGAAACQILR